MLGDKIREARKELGMTLADLAGKVGVTPGHISLIERNQLEPSMTVLRKLSEVLSVPIPVLFAEGNSYGVIVSRKNKRHRVRQGDSGMEYELLSPSARSMRTDPHMTSVSFKLSPLCRSDEDVSYNESDFCIYVTSGTVECSINDTVYTLKAGNSIYIMGNTGYSLYNPDDDEEARGFAVLSPCVF